MQNINTAKVLTKFISALDIPVTKQSIIEHLDKHPNADTVLAFSDVLDYYKVSNEAYQVSADQLSQIPVPFIAYLSDHRFSVVTSYSDKYVKMQDEQLLRKKISTAEFHKVFNNYVLIAEKNNDSGEAGYVEKRKKEILENIRYPFAFSAFFILLMYFIYQQGTFIHSLNVSLGLLFFIKSVGIITSVLLLMQSINANNPFVKLVCGGNHKGNGCSSVLSSEASKLTSFLSWSEVGFFYFAGSWLVLLLSSANPSTMFILALFNLVSLPYTIYSLHYQWKIARSWCRLCCIIQALLWLEFFAFIPYLNKEFFTFQGIEWGLIVTGLALPVLFWIVAKPHLALAKQMEPLKQQLRTFKYDKELFFKLLTTEEQHKLPSLNSSLIIGDATKSRWIITIVSNPYCKPCAEAHLALNELLTNRPDIILQVIFKLSDEKNIAVMRHLLRLQTDSGSSLVHKALHDWFEQKNKSYEDWAKRYPTNQNNVDLSIKEQHEWCEKVQMKGTPEFFVNGRRMPHYYQPRDLMYMLGK